MGWLWSTGRAGSLTALLAAGPTGALAVDLSMLADRERTCAYLATAPAGEVATIEIWLSILQRDAAVGDRQPVARDDHQRLDGEARVIEAAIAVIDEQIVKGHATLRTLRGRLRVADDVSEHQALQAEIRATSEELIEISFDLRDAKARLATMRAAMSGQRDTSAVIDAAQTTARISGRQIRACAMARRTFLAAEAAQSR